MSYPTKTSPEVDTPTSPNTREATLRVNHRRKSSNDNQQLLHVERSQDSASHSSGKRSLPSNRVDMSIDQQISPRLNSVQLSSDFKHLVPNRSPSVSDGSFSLAPIDSNSTNPNILSTSSPRSSIYIPHSANTHFNPHSSISSASSQNAMNTENVIDIMEKEQEGIVLRLMKEIQALNEENKQLKQQLAKYAPNSSLLNTASNSNNSSMAPLTVAGGLVSRHGSISSNSSSLSRSSSQRRSTIGGAVAGNSLLNNQRALPLQNSMGLTFSNYSMNQSYVFPANSSQSQQQQQQQQSQQQQQQQQTATDQDWAEPNRTKRKMGSFCPTTITNPESTPNQRDTGNSVDFTNYSFTPESKPKG